MAFPTTDPLAKVLLDVVAEVRAIRSFAKGVGQTCSFYPISANSLVDAHLRFSACAAKLLTWSKVEGLAKYAKTQWGKDDDIIESMAEFAAACEACAQ